RLHAQVARVFDVLARDVGLGAVRGHAHDARAGVVRGRQVVHGADARQQQRRDLRVLDDAGHRFDPLDVGVRAEAVVEAAALQAVAVRDLDRIDPGLVERAGDAARVLQAVLVADRVAAIAQRHVGDVEFLAVHEGSLFAPGTPSASAPRGGAWPWGGPAASRLGR